MTALRSSQRNVEHRGIECSLLCAGTMGRGQMNEIAIKRKMRVQYGNGTKWSKLSGNQFGEGNGIFDGTYNETCK